MSAFLVAEFNDYAAADRVRTRLVIDGFPTDRVELTAASEPGQAALEPADSPHERFVLYFRTLFRSRDEQEYPERFARRAETGGAVVTVHPRGSVEIERALELLQEAGPCEIVRHELERQTFEFAAARRDVPWARNFWFESSSKADCIYCRLYEIYPHPR